MLTSLPGRLLGVLFDAGMAALMFGCVATIGGLTMPDAVLVQFRDGMHLGTDVPLTMVRLTILGTLATSVASMTLLVACISALLRLLVAPTVSLAWAKAMTTRTARHGVVRTRETADVA